MALLPYVGVLRKFAGSAGGKPVGARLVAERLNTPSRIPNEQSAIAARRRELKMPDWKVEFLCTVLFAMGSNIRYGKPVPDLDFTSEMSELLIEPLAVTS